MCCSSRDLPLVEVTETTEDRTGCLLQVDLGCPVDGGGVGGGGGGGGGGGSNSGGHGEDCKEEHGDDGKQTFSHIDILSG